MNTGNLVDDTSAEYNLNNASDETLVTKAKIGERDAFVEIGNRYSKLIFRMVYRITKNEEDAEDMLQEALLNGFVHLKSFDGRSKISTWLTRIAINSTLMTLRKRRMRPEISIDIYTDDEIWQPWEMPDQSIDIELNYLQYEREEHLRKAIQDLRPVFREVIEIQRLHDGSIKEIAEMAGISVAATKSRLIRARVALRASLQSFDL